MSEIGIHKNIIECIEFGLDFIASDKSLLKGNYYLALEYAPKTLFDYATRKS
jgi:hypothetical protein